ncbi:winged helix-turn-helix transcriptional regulator [Thioclava sp. FR2]|uniref:winged helix-turn-helix transcriptional regulator n=1 Tax=Thioclava sp. FR2 TaxID=3445780 RepID=UPI003EBE1D88
MQLPIAVLSGDLVDSTEYSSEAVDRAIDRIQRIAEDHETSTFTSPVKFTRFRGDGWQFAVGYVPEALRLAVRCISVLKGSVDLPHTRIAIGIGIADSMGTTSLADAHGSAFTVSGQALDWLSKTNKRLTIAGQASGVTALHQIATEALMLRINKWTREQSEAATLFLRNPKISGKEIAETLGITPQAVSARLTGAEAQDVGELLTSWEEEFQLYPEQTND